MRTISENGLLFTSLWEKFIPVAYKATHSEKYYTIGWGHYGPDVKQGQQITKHAAYSVVFLAVGEVHTCGIQSNP